VAESIPDPAMSDAVNVLEKEAPDSDEKRNVAVALTVCEPLVVIDVLVGETVKPFCVVGVMLKVEVPAPATVISSEPETLPTPFSR
jgi:hypothetical protein